MPNSEKIITGFIILTIVIAALSLFYASKSLFFPSEINQDAKSVKNQMWQRMSGMSLTSFDVDLAKEFMDKDNDGKCDS